MDVGLVRDVLEERKPILKSELQKILNISNKNTFNQTLSNLVAFKILRRVENGLYYLPSSDEKFSMLEPSLKDILNKKYLEDHSGIRTGSYLLYKYKLTSQISGYYEILTNNVSKNVRSRRAYNDKVIVSHSKFKINENNYMYGEFLELFKNIEYSDYNRQESYIRLKELLVEQKLKKDKVFKYLQYYNGPYYNNFRKEVKEVLNNEST